MKKRVNAFGIFACLSEGDDRIRIDRALSAAETAHSSAEIGQVWFRIEKIEPVTTMANRAKTA
jgi:hypothetical protein